MLRNIFMYILGHDTTLEETRKKELEIARRKHRAIKRWVQKGKTSEIDLQKIHKELSTTEEEETALLEITRMMQKGK